MSILCKAIQALTSKLRKGRRSVAHSSDDEPRKECRSPPRNHKGCHAIVHRSDDDDTSEYEASWSLQRAFKESEYFSCVDHFLPELKMVAPALVDDDDSDVPHMLAGAEADEYDNARFDFEYITGDPHLSAICDASNAEKIAPRLQGSNTGDLSEDLSEDRFLHFMQPQPPYEEDILETYLRNKQEFAKFIAADNSSSSSLKSIESKKRKQVITTGPLLEATLTQMIFEPSTTFHHRSA